MKYNYYKLVTKEKVSQLFFNYLTSGASFFCRFFATFESKIHFFQFNDKNTYSAVVGVTGGVGLRKYIFLEFY